MAKMKIRRERDKSKFDRLIITLNAEPLEFDNDVVEVDIELDKLYYITAFFIVTTEKTSLTLHLTPPESHPVKFQDYPEDDSSKVTWTANLTTRPYYEKRRLYLEP